MGRKGGMPDKAKTRRWKKLAWKSLSIKSVSLSEKRKEAKKVRGWKGWGC